MKIAVLCGSPKGEKSLTLQYMKYIARKFPADQYDFLHIGKEIRKIENDAGRFDQIMECIRGSDAAVWCTPVFFLLAPSQIVRFVELIFERDAAGAFAGKYATSVTTSVKFFDHTAHQYLHAVSADLGMKYVEGFSAKMDDLFNLKKRESFLSFWGHFLDYRREKLDDRPAAAQETPVPMYEPGRVESAPKKERRKILLLTDAKEGDTNLIRMTDVFVRMIPNEVEVININDVDIKGGCVSCYTCAEENDCVYKDQLKETSDKFFGADAIIFAGTIRRRYLSSRWKMFNDRLFVYGHVPVFAGRQFAHIISGQLAANPHIRALFEGMIESSEANCAGFVTDESGDPQAVSRELEALGKKLLVCAGERYVRPQTFLGTAGRLIFRDMVYELKWFFRADYAYYSKHGLMDYPPFNLKTRMTNLLMGAMMAIPGMRKKLYERSGEEMIKPFEKIE